MQAVLDPKAMLYGQEAWWEPRVMGSEDYWMDGGEAG